MMHKILLTFILVFCAAIYTNATHVVGGAIEYERIGTGSLPNSSRYKIKLKLWRDAYGIPWFPINPLIEVRGDTLGYTSAGFDPYVATYPGGNIYPYSGLDRMNDFSAGSGISRQFIRDFRIACGSPLDTLTVRTGAFGNTAKNNNTKLTTTTGVPGYENPSYDRLLKPGYTVSQYLQDGYGFSIGVCDATGNSLGANNDRTNYTDACAADQTSPYGRLCVPQYVDSCTFVPKVFIQYAVYIRVVDLPNIPGGYHLKFNLSARNNAIVNLNNPAGTSFTVYARIPDIAQLDGSAGSFTNITTLTSSIVTTVTSVLSFTGPSAVNNTASPLPFTGIASTNTIPGPFLATYTSLGIPGITAINANIITSNKVLITSIAGIITTVTSRIVSTSILGITTTGFTANSLAYPQVSSTTGLDVQISGVNTITAPYLNPINNIRNSSPRFKSVPPLFVCQYSAYVASLGINQNPQYDHSAFDADGDSIQYDLVFPNDGSDGGSGPAKTDEMFVGYWKSAASANINGTIFTTGMPLYATTLAGFPYPENVNLATFNPVSFKSPFTDQLPLGNTVVGSITTPGIVLNKSTGIMDIKPLVPPGLYVVSVRAREFRRPSGTVTGLRFLGDITRDYQFRVLSCPLPAQAFIGASIDPQGINVCKGVPTVFSPPNNSTAAAFATGTFYWDSGKDRFVNSFGGPNLYPVRLASSNNLMVTTPLGINEKNGNPASFSYSVAGTYYTKLVVQDRGTKCADSVFAAINISNVKSGWFQTPRGPICVNSAIIFDPYQPSTISGFVSVSGSSLWTNPETNLIPRVSVSGFSGVSATYTGIATSVNGTAMTLTNYTGFIDFLWMQPDGFSRKRIPPPLAAAAKIVFMTWNLGNGNFQSLTLAGSNWVSFGPVVPGLTITGANSLPNSMGGINLSLPGINYPYPAPGNFKVTLTVYNQFGCSDSLQRNITIIQQQPMASGVGGDVCINNAVISVTGNITIATGGIWSGGLGSYLPSQTQPGSAFTMQYKPSAAELIPGTVVGLKLSTYGNGVCPIGNSTVIAINIKDKPHVLAGPAATICGNNMQYQLNGIVTGVGSNLSVDGGNFQAYWKSKGTGTFVGLGTVIGSNTTISTNTTSGFVKDTYMFSKADSLAGSVKLYLIAANTGICKSISDSIVLTMLPAAQLPNVTPGNNQLVCANNSKVVLNGSVTNSPLGGLWTTMGTGTFAGFILSTNTLTGPNAFYTPSKVDSAAGSVKLVLSTNITSVNGGCFNVSKFITVTIGPSPTIIFGAIPSACVNNPITNLVATIVGSTGVLWSGSGIPFSFGGGTYNPGSNSPNIVSLGSGIFQTSLTYTALNTETTSPGIKLINISTTGNGICSPVTAQSAINYQPAQVVSILGPASVSVCKNNTSYSFTTKITNFKIGVTIGQWSSSGSGTFSPGVVLTTNSAVFTYTPSSADTATGNVRLIIAVSSNDGKGYDCKISYDTLNITYTNLPTVNPGPNQIICENNLIAKLSGSVTSPATGGIWSTNGTGSFGFAGSGRFTSTILGDNYFPSATDRSNGSVKLTLTTTGTNIGSGSGQCSAIAKSITITFSSVPTIQFGTVPQVCENNSTVLLTATIIGQNPGQNITATTMGTWGKGAGTYVPGVNNFNLVSSPSLGLVSSGSVTYTPDAFELASKVVNMAVTATGIGNCNAISAPLTFNISPKPMVDITTPNPTICGNNAHAILNAVISGANGGTWSGGLNPVLSTQTGNNFVATYDPNSTEINNGNAKLYLTTNGVLNNCNPVVDSTFITITKAPVVATGGNILICTSGASQVTITGSVLNAGGGIWNTSGTGKFLTSNASSVSINGGNMTTVYIPSATDKLAISPAPLVHLSLTSTNNGNCLAVSDEITMEFGASPNANAGPDQTVCGNDFPIHLDATGNNGHWTTSVTGVFGNAALLSTTFNPSMVIPVGGTKVKFTWVPDPLGSCSGNPSDMFVTILPAPIVNIISANTVCGSGGFFPISVNGSGFSGGSWFAVSGVFSTTGANTSSSIPEAYKPSAADIAGESVTISFTGGNTFPCTAKAVSKTIKIDPAITIDPGTTQTFCDDITSINLTGKVFVKGVQTTSGVNVLWNKLSSVTGLYGGPSATSTLYNPVFTPTPADKASGSIVLLLSTPGLGTCSSPGTSSVEYRFQKSPTATILGIPAVVCSDTSYVQLSGTFTGSAGMVWSTTGTGSFSPDNTNMNAKYILSNGDKTVSGITFKIINVGSGLCTNSASTTQTVTIVGKPIVDAGPDLTICGNNTAITLTGANMTTTGVAVPTSVIWYLSNVVAPIGTFSSNSIPANGVGTLPVYFPSSKEKIVDQIVTVFVSVSGVGITGFPNVCPGQSDKRIFTFTPAPVVTAGANQVLCGDATSNILTLTGTTTIANSGRWTANQGIGTIIGINGLTAKYSVNAADKSILSTTLGFTFTVTFPGSTASIIGCVNVSTTTSVTLTSVPGVSITGGNQTICGDALFTNPLNGISSTGFGTWSTTTPGTFSPNNSTLTGAKFAPLLTEMVSAYTTGKPIKIKLNTALNGVCSAKSDSIFVTVTTPPAITAGSDTTVCTDVGTVPLYGAVITVSSGMIWSTSSSQGRFVNTGTITSQGITTTGPNALVRKIIVQDYIPGAAEKNAGSVVLTARSTLSGTCANVFAVKNITFIKEPTVSVGPNQSVCSNNSVVNCNAVVTNAVRIRWYQLGGTNGRFSDSTAASTQYFPGYQDSVSTAIGSVVSITCIVMGNNLCQAKSATFALKVTPSPVVKTIGTISVCSDTSGVQFSGVTLPSLTTVGVQWANFTNPASTATNFSPSKFVLNPKYIPSAADIASGTVKLLVSTTGNGGCIGGSDTLKVIILPKPTITAGPDQNLCSDFGGTIRLSFTGANFNNTDIGIWSSSGDGNFGSPVPITFTGVGEPTYYNVSSGDFSRGRVTIQVSAQKNLCRPVIGKVNVTFTGAPLVSAGNVQTNCYIVGKVLTLTGSVVGTETYKYTWFHTTHASTLSGVFANGNDTLSAVATVVGTAGIEKYTTGAGDGVTETFKFLVTGTGICRNQYSSSVDLRNKKPIDLGITAPLTICSDISSFNVSVYDKKTGFGSDSTFSTGGGDGLVWSAKNSKGQVANFSQFSPGIFSTSTFTYTPSNAGVNSDRNSTLIGFTFTSTGSSICPSDTATAYVIVTPAPTVSPLAGLSACSNNQTVSLTGIASNFTSVQWISSSAPIFQGTFTGANSLLGTYTPSANEISNGIANLVLTASKFGCTDVSVPLAIAIKQAPVVNPGAPGSVCSLTGITVTGTIQPPLSVVLGSLWSVDGASPGSGTPGTQVITTTPGIMSVQNTFSSLTTIGAPFITLRLTANEPSCASVSSTVTYTFVGTPILDPGTPRTQCASDVIQLTPGAASAMGVWTTSGQGVFASTNTITTANMNDIYLPSAGEILNGTVLGFTLVGQPSSCGTPVNVSVNYTITSGMSVKADSKKVVSVCTNASPSFTGTISGSSMGVWTSNGSGTFANGENIVSGTLVGTKFVFQDTYTPSDADKTAGRVVLRLTAVPDGINSLCSNTAFDTLSLFFTAPPTVNANGDKRVCANVAVTTIAGGGVSISGSAFLPSPNSTDPNATPVNAARWRWLSSVSTPGYFMSTNTTTGQVVSFSGTALNITINLSEVYIPSSGEAFSTNSPVKLVLESFYAGTIVGGATCVPAIDTIDVNFNPAPSAIIIFTGTGICTDIDQFDLYGNIAQAMGGVWSTSGTGSLLPDNVWNSPTIPTTYKLSAAELATTSPIMVKFTLETTNNPGCYSTISSVLTVTINPRPVVSITGAQTICADLTVITLTGGSVTPGSIPSKYTWITNGTGSISGINSAAGANLPGVYTLTQSDISFGSLLFTLSTSGPNTCKPITKNMDVTITPAPTISLTSRQELCRDSDTMRVTAALSVSTGVIWTVNRCSGGVCGVTATGTFFTGTGTSLTGVFLPSANDLLAANTDSLEFTAVSTGNNISGSSPSCNSVMARTYIKLTPKPSVSITSLPGICADLTSINLMGVVSVAGGGKWASTGGGTFFSEFSLPSVAYQLSDVEKNFIFPTTVGISLTSDANGTCKPISTTFILSITGSPKVETGPDRNVCADAKSIDLSAAVATLTGGGFAWNTFGTGTFTGASSTFTGITTLPGSWTYKPSSSDSANGAVILVLTTTGPNPCNPVESYITIKFDRTPNVIISAGVDQVVCADNPLINLDGRTNGQNPSWHVFKDSTVPGNDLSGPGGPGLFSPDTVTLNASYFPSVFDTTGATKNFTNQVLRIRLRAYGTGTCSSQIYESNMNVTFTPLPRIDVLISPSSICTNDQSPITLSGRFLNDIAAGGAWTSSGSANSALPFASVVNPPSITGIVYQPTAADKINGSGGGNSEISGRVGFTFTTQAQGTCKAISKSIPLIIYKAPSINPGTDRAICETQSLVSLSGITTGVLTGRWRSSGSGKFLNGTNPGANMITITGGKINDSYAPTAADIAAGSINLFLASRTQSNSCPSDSARIALSFDLVPIVNTGLTQTICAEPGLVSLTGAVLNATKGIWSVSTPGSGSFNPGADTVNTVYKFSENDKNLSQLIFSLTSNSSTSKCPQVSSAPLVININKVPIASIDYTYLCTSTGLQLFGGISNALFGTWTTSGTGVFTPTSAPLPFVTGGTQYFPSDPDIASGVTITLEAHGLGACPSSKAQITPSLTDHPSPFADAGSDATICLSQKYELNVLGLNDIIRASYTYQWLKPSITGISTVLSAIAKVNITDVTVYADSKKGDSLYVLKVTDNINKCVTLDTVKIRAIEPVNLGLISSICFEDNLILPSKPVTITGGTYQWYIDGQISQKDKNPNRIKANTAGNYTLQFTQFGCQSSATTLVKGRVILQTKGKVVCVNEETSLTPYILPYVQNTLIVVTLTGGTTVLGVRRDTLHPDYIFKWYYQHNKLYLLGSAEGNYASEDTTTTLNLDGSFTRGKYTRDTIHVSISQDTANFAVSVTAFGCETIDTVRVKTHPKPAMQLVDVPACEGDLVQLEGRPSNMESPKTFAYPPSNRKDTIWSGIKWNTFPSGLIQPPTDTVHKITVTTAGTYFVKYQIGECIGRDTSKVDFNYLPTVTNLSMVKYCPEGGKGITLDAGYGSGYHYLWLASGKENQYELVYDTLKYYFKVYTNHNCSVLDSITVNASCEPRIFTPDAFIPDGPEENKYFRVYGKNFVNFNIRIYNRWGEVIFSSHDKDFGWDGTYQGSKMPTGVYPYIITYDGQYEDYKKQKLERGKVTLVR